MKFSNKYFNKDLLVSVFILVFLVHYIAVVAYPHLGTMSQHQLVIHCVFTFVTFWVVGLIRSRVVNRDTAMGIWLIGLLVTFIALMIIDTPRESHPVYYAGMVVLLYYVADMVVAGMKCFLKWRESSRIITKTEE